MPTLIKEVQTLLAQHASNINIKKSLHLLFTDSHFGCQKHYPIAIVHESSRIKEPESLHYFKETNLLDSDRFTPKEYTQKQLEDIAQHTPKYIQQVDYIISNTKMIPHPQFSNKFKHDYWKKLTSIDELEAVIDISVLHSRTSNCEVEANLRAIIRKRKEVHQLKKITFIWLVASNKENPHISTVMKHYFEDNTMKIVNENKTYYLGWSTPLQSINMRYFVCPPE